MCNLYIFDTFMINSLIFSVIICSSAKNETIQKDESLLFLLSFILSFSANIKIELATQ